MNRRNKIIDKCPEDFLDDLNIFINDIEEELNDIIDTMTIDKLSNLDDIITAYSKLENLAESIY